MKIRSLAILASILLVAVLVAIPASARLRISGDPGYYPLPDTYQEGLVRDWNGVIPGTTTLQEVLDTIGQPIRVVNYRYFYYQVKTTYQDQPDIDDVYIEFNLSKQMGEPTYNGDGLALNAVVKRIYVYSRARMAERQTYMDQVETRTVYPYTTYYDPFEDYYSLVYPYQGYGMYFDRDHRFNGEVFFEPRKYEDRNHYNIRNGKFNFMRQNHQEMPKYLRSETIPRSQRVITTHPQPRRAPLQGQPQRKQPK